MSFAQAVTVSGQLSFQHPRHQLDQVAGSGAVIQLVTDQLAPAGAAGAGGAGQAEDQRAVGEARCRPGLDGRRADLLVAELPEELAEAVDGLVEERLERLRRRISLQGRDLRRQLGRGRRPIRPLRRARRLLQTSAQTGETVEKTVAAATRNAPQRILKTSPVPQYFTPVRPAFPATSGGD